MSRSFLCILPLCNAPGPWLLISVRLLHLESEFGCSFLRFLRYFLLPPSAVCVHSVCFSPLQLRCFQPLASLVSHFCKGMLFFRMRLSSSDAIMSIWSIELWKNSYHLLCAQLRNRILTGELPICLSLGRRILALFFVSVPTEQKCTAKFCGRCML